MKILEEDEKEEYMKILPETLDDLWHLSHIIEKGDIITSKTTRRIQDTTGDKLRNDRGIKKTFILDVKIENISFHMFTGKLRLTGTIIKGPEDLIPLGSHHTIEVKLNQSLTIHKTQLSDWTLKRLNQAIESSKKLSAIIISIDDEEANIGLIRQFGLEYYGPIHSNISGKRNIDKNRDKNKKEFYEKIYEIINRFENVSTYVISGPGFYKNDLLKYLQNKHPEISKKSIIENTGMAGKNGIQEVLKKGTIEKLTVENRVSYEVSLLEKAFEEMVKKDSKVTYGINEVTRAANLGAVSKLLVIDKLMKDNDFKEILTLVENMSGEIVVISSEHDSGKQLEALGGAIAWLRYPI